MRFCGLVLPVKPVNPLMKKSRGQYTRGFFIMSMKRRIVLEKQTLVAY